MAAKEVVLTNEAGLHARPATMLVSEVSKYNCDIKLIKDGREYNPRSIMSVLSMGAVKDDNLLIRVIGTDEENVLEAIVDFIENKIID